MYQCKGKKKKFRMILWKERPMFIPYMRAFLNFCYPLPFKQISISNKYCKFFIIHKIHKRQNFIVYDIIRYYNRDASSRDSIKEPPRGWCVTTRMET